MKTFLKIALLLIVTALPNSTWAAQNILVFGDSLSAGYGISRNASWVSLLQEELRKNHPQYEVINASISGETTSGGLRRIDKALAQHQPTIVIVELGANDGLRGTTIAETEKNLRQIISKSKKVNAAVLLLGMRLPPNYGLEYSAQFRVLFSKVAKSQKISLVPFMLEGISPEQFQADNLHPSAAAQTQILQNVFPSLKPFLKRN